MVQPRLYPFLVVLLAGAGLALVVVAVARRHRDAAGARPLSIMMAAVALWSTGYSLQLASESIAWKLLWARFVATGTLLATLFWLVFVLRYAGRDRWLTRGRLAALAAIPAVVILAAWTNHLHGQVWSDARLTYAGDVPLLASTHGPAFDLAVVFGYLAVGTSFVVILDLLVRSRSVYRLQAIVLLIAGLVPTVGNAVYLTLGRTVVPVDLTPFLFTTTGAIVAFGLFQFRMLDLAPVSPGHLLADLPEAVAVLDGQNRIVHTNHAADRLAADDRDPVGRDFADVFPAIGAAFGSTARRGQNDPGSGADRATDSTVSDTSVSADSAGGAPAGPDSAAPDRAGGDASTDPTGRHAEVTVEVDGAERVFDCEFTPLSRGPQGEGSDLLVCRDVTERKRRERELAEYKTIFETVQDMVYVLDDTGHVRLVNEPLADLLGLEPAEVVGRHVTDVVDAGVVDAGGDALAELVDGAATEATFECTLTAGDGRAVPCESHVALLPAESGYRGLVGTVRDISQRKRAQADLRETSDTLEAVFEAAPMPIVVLDGDLVVQRVNAAAEDLFGWDEDVSGNPLPVADKSGAPGATLGAVAADVADGGVVQGRERTVETPQRGQVHIRIAGAPLAATARGGVVLVCADVSETRYREQQVAILNRVLRHNLRNDLSVVLGHADSIADAEIPTGVADQARTIATVADELLSVSSKAKQAEDVVGASVELEPVDVGRVVELVAASAARRHPDADLRVTGDVGAAGARAFAPKTLGVAVDNVIENAIEHTDHDRPTVTVTTRTTDDEVVIEVADDGPGIPDIEREVLVTGRETPLHHGSGLGLWVVHWIVTRAGGDLEFHENDPRGSVVTLRLRRADASPESRRPPARSVRKRE